MRRRADSRPALVAAWRPVMDTVFVVILALLLLGSAGLVAACSALERRK
jgi:hypothetical protein